MGTLNARKWVVICILLSHLTTTTAEACWLLRRIAGIKTTVTKPEFKNIADELPTELKDAQELAKIHKIPKIEDRLKAKEDYYDFKPTFWTKVPGIATLGAAATFAGFFVEKFLQHPDYLSFLTASGAALVGYYFADRLSYEGHWKQDNTWYNSKNKTLRDLARDGRKHHEDPAAYLRNTYLGRVGELYPLVLPTLAGTTALLTTGGAGKLADLALAPLGVPEGTVGPMVDTTVGAMLGAFAIGGAHATWTHQASHGKSNLFMRTLQALRIAIPRDKHMAHHKAPFDEVFATLSGWSNVGRGREYVNKRLRSEYEKTGVMPGTWIQSPDNIPKDIVEKLQSDYEKNVASIPDLLWAYAPMAYPKRVPPELVKPLAFVQEKWRSDFIAKRHRENSDQIEKLGYDEANKRFQEEQLKYPWIFGPVPQPLNSTI